MALQDITSFNGGISDFDNIGIKGAFKFAKNLDIRKSVDSISAGQALKDIGIFGQNGSSSTSPSSSVSPSASSSPSPSNSPSPSASISPSVSHSGTPSPSISPSSSISASASVSPSSSQSPSPSPSAGYTTIFQDLIRTFVNCSDGFTYGFGHTGKIYKIAPDGYTQMVYDLHKEIKGAFEKPSSSKNIYLIFATDTELHHKLIPGASNWSDVDKTLANWPKTNLTSAPYHTMNNVGGDILIANGATLAMAAYDDSYTNEALDLIPGNIAKTLVERSGRAIIGTYKAAGTQYGGVNGAIDTEVPLAQMGDDGNIVYADMTTTMPIKRFPGGGRVNPGGVTNFVQQADFFEWEQDSLSWINKQVVGNLAMFAVYNAEVGKGGIYTYGRLNKQQLFTLNLEYAFDADELGALTVINGIPFVSYQIGAEYGVFMVDMENKAIGVYEGLDFKSPPRTPALITPYSNVELYMKPLPPGCSVEFWYRMNKIGDFVRANTADQVPMSSYTKTGGVKATFKLGISGEIYEPRIVINPNGNETPEVYRIRTLFG